MVCKPIQFSADSTILCPSVNVFITYVYVSICWCLVNDSCMSLIIWYNTYSLSLCTAGVHITMIVHICLLPPSILIIVGHPMWESVSYCFNILLRGSSVCQVHWSLRYCSAVMGVVLMCLLFLVMMWPIFCNYYCVGSVVMVMVTSTNYCAMGPWSHDENKY